MALTVSQSYVGVDPIGPDWVKRCVIIQKDERGYGLRVSGESPVFVESVKEGGAAWKAGVQAGDKIIKVSGTMVWHHHHGEVVRLIQSCGSYVGLTLMSPKTPTSAPKAIQITAPQPASQDTQHVYDESKVVMFKDMIRKQNEYLAQMVAKKNQLEVEKTLKSIQKLEKEIEKMTFDVSRHRPTSMSAENLTTGATSDPTIVGANANAKKSHSFGQYDTRAPIMTMESDDENEDFANNNANNRRNSSFLNAKPNNPDINEIPKTVNALHGHSLQMTRFLLTQESPDMKPHALLFHTMAGHVFPMLAAQSAMTNRRALQRLAWQIASTWMIKDSPLNFIDFPQTALDNFATTLESSQSSLETLFEPFFEPIRDILVKQLERWRNAVNIGLAPRTMPTAKEELHKIIELVLQDSITNLDQSVDVFISHLNVKNVSTLAVVTTLLTIGHFVFACRSKHLLITQTDSSCLPINPVLKLSLDHSSTSNKKHKRAVSCPNRNQSPGHNEAGHHFTPANEIKPIYCSSGCVGLLWGTYGLTCTHCQLSVHIWCMKSAANSSPCPGPQSNNQSNDKTPTGRQNPKRSRRWNSDRNAIIDMIKKAVSAPNHDSHAPPLISSSSSSSDDEDDDNVTFGSTVLPFGESIATNSTAPTPPNTISRSESFKQRRKTVPSYRKRSDPALPTSNASTLAQQSASQPQDPTLSTDLFASPTTTSPDTWQLSSSDDEDEQSQSDVHQQSTGSPTVSPQHTLDEDTPPPLPPRPPSEKRIQIQSEIIKSQEQHIVVLEFIYRVFYKPIKSDNLLNKNELKDVFCNVRRLLDVHKNILTAFKAKNKSLEQSLCDVFCGQLGTQLAIEAAKFCANQKLGGLDTWKARKKDSKLKHFHDPEVRTKAMPETPLARLSLEDHLGTVFQRPLRYQLLLDRLLHATPSDSLEYQLVDSALTRSREINSLVNEATRRAENNQRLNEIIKKTDRAQGLIFDLKDHTLIHEGALMWRITKQKCVDVLLLLTDKILVILVRESNDRFTLKYHTNPASKSNQTNCPPMSPFVLLHDAFTKDVATDQNAFFIISPEHSVFYEFAAPTRNEKKQWQDCISKVARPTQQVIKLQDLTSQPSTDEIMDPSTEDQAVIVDRDVDNLEFDELSASAVTDDQNNNNNSSVSPETSEPFREEEEQMATPSRVEGVIRYVREDEVRPPELISPTRVTISNEPIVDEALVIRSPEQRILEIDSNIKLLLNEKRRLLANSRGITDEYEWTVVSDMGEHDHRSSAAREVTFFEKAMSLVSTLATDGLTTESYAPLVGLRDQIDALLARLTIDSDTQTADAESTLYFPASDQLNDETAVYF